MLSSTSILSLLVFAVTTLGARQYGFVSEDPHPPTVYLLGDSTMALSTDGIIQGWGAYFPFSCILPVINKAIGGRSLRSYTREDRFKEVINMIKPNDIAILEFGHNDGGGLTPDNGRSVCGGSGPETCESVYNGTKETVHTFSYYLTDAGKKLIEKGAFVIISSQTPNNPWESGSFSYTVSRFAGYAIDVAKALGPNAMYVDHGAYTASIYQQIGKKATDALFPQDHTHTGPKGAEVVANAFVKGVQCGGGGFLQGYLKNTTESIEGKCISEKKDKAVRGMP